MEKIPTVSIDLIVENIKGQVLLGKVTQKWQDNGKYLWGLPGREILFGDSIYISAKKQLLAETGLALSSARVVCINSNFGYGNHYVSIGIIVNATGEIDNKNPEDWERWEWFDKNKMPEQLFPSAKLTLRSYLSKKISLDLPETK